MSNRKSTTAKARDGSLIFDPDCLHFEGRSRRARSPVVARIGRKEMDLADLHRLPAAYRFCFTGISVEREVRSRTMSHDQVGW